jgi:hypothetical protein
MEIRALRLVIAAPDLVSRQVAFLVWIPVDGDDFVSRDTKDPVRRKRWSIHQDGVFVIATSNEREH